MELHELVYTDREVTSRSVTQHAATTWKAGERNLAGERCGTRRGRGRQRLSSRL